MKIGHKNVFFFDFRLFKNCNICLVLHWIRLKFELIKALFSLFMFFSADLVLLI